MTEVSFQKVDIVDNTIDPDYDPDNLQKPQYQLYFRIEEEII